MSLFLLLYCVESMTRAIIKRLWTRLPILKYWRAEVRTTGLSEVATLTQILTLNYPHDAYPCLNQPSWHVKRKLNWLWTWNYLRYYCVFDTDELLCVRRFNNGDVSLLVFQKCGASTATQNTSNTLLGPKYCSIDDINPITNHKPHHP